jgi:hypothetical protein
VCLCVAAAVAACNQSTPSLEGFTCSSDADCNQGLKCMPYLGLNDGGLDDGAHGGPGDGGPGDAGSEASACFSSGNECLVPCHTNSDCAPPLICFTACGQSACEAPGLMGVPLEASVEASE